MDAECLQYALTEAERLHFAEQGYLIVKGALTKERGCKAGRGERPNLARAHGEWLRARSEFIFPQFHWPRSTFHQPR